MAADRTQQQRAATLLGVNGILLGLVGLFHGTSWGGGSALLIATVLALLFGLGIGAFGLIRPGRITLRVPLPPPNQRTTIADYEAVSSLELLRSFCAEMLEVLGTKEFERIAASRQRWMRRQAVFVTIGLTLAVVLMVLGAVLPRSSAT